MEEEGVEATEIITEGDGPVEAPGPPDEEKEK
jgi:hypothetical protein